MSEEAIFLPDEILRRLVAAGVRFVLVGGLAAQAHGSTSLTNDLDICYARDSDNLRALAGVLTDIVATRRGLPANAPRMPPLDARTLRASSLFTLSTRFGDFDLLANPDPGFDFETLIAGAIPATTAGVRVVAAGLDDLMAMKRAAGRPKDRVELEILGALREELDRRRQARPGGSRRDPASAASVSAAPSVVRIPPPTIQGPRSGGEQP